MKEEQTNKQKKTTKQKERAKCVHYKQNPSSRILSGFLVNLPLANL